MSAAAQQRDWGIESPSIACDNTSPGVATIAVNAVTSSKRLRLYGWIAANDDPTKSATWAITLNAVAYASGVFCGNLVVFPPQPLIIPATGNIVLTVTGAGGNVSAALFGVLENA